METVFRLLFFWTNNWKQKLLIQKMCIDTSGGCLIAPIYEMMTKAKIIFKLFDFDFGVHSNDRFNIQIALFKACALYRIKSFASYYYTFDSFLFLFFFFLLLLKREIIPFVIDVNEWNKYKLILMWYFELYID